MRVRCLFLYLSWNSHNCPGIFIRIYINNPSKYLYIRSHHLSSFSSFQVFKILTHNLSSFSSFQVSVKCSYSVCPHVVMCSHSVCPHDGLPHDPFHCVKSLTSIYNLPSTTLSNIFKIKDSEESSFIFSTKYLI